MRKLLVHLASRYKAARASRPDREPPAAPRAHEDATELIRQAMLDAVGASRDSAPHSLRLRIALAKGSQGLWCLRSELMAVLANMRGEGTAREEMGRITAMFEGMLPHGLDSCVRTSCPMGQGKST